MKVTLDEWQQMTKKPVRVCEGADDVIPKAIFIGVMGEDGAIETHIKLVAASEWNEFRKIWERISGINYSQNQNQSPRMEHQFFLICN